jgi:hypothetical protein
MIFLKLSLAAEHPHPFDENTRGCRQKEEHIMIFPMFKHLLLSLLIVLAFDRGHPTLAQLLETKCRLLGWQSHNSSEMQLS